MVTICVDLGGTLIKLGLVNNGEVFSFETIPVVPGGIETNLNRIKIKADEMILALGMDIHEAIGVGFSFPGLVNSDANTVISTNEKFDDARGFNFTKWSENQWNLPLFLLNDARMALLGEWRYGAGKDYENLVMVTLGTGVGSAVVMENKLLIGKHYQAGNLGGHFSINYNGIRCTCGNIGCLESEVSSWRLPSLIKNDPEFGRSSLRNEQILDFRALFEVLETGDNLAVKIFDHCICAWSAGIINMIHAYDPDVVVIGGGIMGSSEKILPELQKRINQYAWTSWGEVPLKKAQRINRAALIGADYWVRKNLIHN